MEITLRKANAVQASINEALKDNVVNPVFTMDEFAVPAAAASTAQQDFQRNLELRSSLLDALYEIRKAVSSVNAQLKLDDLLADLARLDKEIDFNNNLSRNQVGLDATVVQAKLDKIRNRDEKSYYLDSSVTSTVFTKEDISNLKKKVKTLKREKQKLQDKLLELNVASTITLSAEAVQVLTEQDIL